MSLTFKLPHQTLTANRIFCIGRNYVAHVHELKNEIPRTPVIFMKPASALVPPGRKAYFPVHGEELHHEVEVVILIGRKGGASNREEARSFIAGLTLGIDLTLRDVQNRLKEKGLPWEIAKAFDHSALIGDMTPFDREMDLANIEFSCFVNGSPCQQGTTAKMIFPITELIKQVSQIWELLPGDLIYTGTPEGVGPLQPDDQISAHSEQLGKFSWHIE